MCIRDRDVYDGRSNVPGEIGATLDEGNRLRSVGWRLANHGNMCADCRDGESTGLAGLDDRLPKLRVGLGRDVCWCPGQGLRVELDRGVAGIRDDLDRLFN